MHYILIHYFSGGEKYVYHGILFKFAMDWMAIYGGDQYANIKNYLILQICDESCSS
jgi:hypothetical protein